MSAPGPALAADLVVVAHLAFILFAVFGSLAALRWPRVAWLHLPALVWAGGIMIVGGICPLTPIENRLREAAQGPTYDGGFVDHYLVPLIYPPGLTHRTQLAGAALLFGLNAVVYGLVWRRRRIGTS
ncbi:MAG: DUF2784 domain-containing protein [Alphaproteobacteria bacterium]|nr:MAG: DUF2784 domain-containing protein [Alphaproteobacteria bacterium]